MPLPRVQHPTLPLLVPSHRKAFRFRPFTVKEEKILLMAKESDDPTVDHFRAIHQVVTNCSVEDSLNVDELATFDLEWLFLKLTAVSVGPTVDQGFYDKEEREKLPPEQVEAYQFKIKLDDVVAPVVPDDWKGMKQVTVEGGSDSVFLGYPPAVLYTDPDFARDDLDQILYRSTRTIVTPTQTFKTSEFTKEDVVEYFESWRSQDMKPIYDFLYSTPSMRYEITYTNKLGSERKITLSSLSDFFTY